MCLDEGRTEAAVIVDHKVPLIHGGLDVDSNTRNLCRHHDLIVTAEQFGFDKAAGGRGVAIDGRPTGADHAWGAARPAPSPRAEPRRPTPPGGSKVGPADGRTPTLTTVNTASSSKVKSSGAD
jgi:hypothetical protein